MLILSRRQSEQVLFPSLGITVEVVQLSNRSVRLGIDAPVDIHIIRAELQPKSAEEFRKSDARFSHPTTIPASDALALQRCLESTTLAIRLAQNQLRQQHNDNADEALDNALECLDRAQVTLDSSKRAETASNSVHEFRARYAIAGSDGSANDNQSTSLDSQNQWNSNLPISYSELASEASSGVLESRCVSEV